MFKYIFFCWALYLTIVEVTTEDGTLLGLFIFMLCVPAAFIVHDLREFGIRGKYFPFGRAYPDLTSTSHSSTIPKARSGTTHASTTSSVSTPRQTHNPNPCPSANDLLLERLAADLLLNSLYMHSEGHLEELKSHMNTTRSMNGSSVQVQKILPVMDRLYQNLLNQPGGATPRTPMLPPIQSDSNYGNLWNRLHQGVLSLDEVIAMANRQIAH